MTRAERDTMDRLLAGFGARTLVIERNGRVVYQATDLDDLDRAAVARTRYDGEPGVMVWRPCP